VRAVALAGPDADPVGLALRAVRPDGALAVRMTRPLLALAEEIRNAEVVYATELYHRVAGIAAPLGVPVVMKLVNDPAYERARHRGWYSGSLAAFQSAPGGRLAALRALRSRAVSRAARVVVPSRFLARLARGWSRRSVEVVPNPSPPSVPAEDREVLRRRLGMEGPTAVFAGRLVRQKDLPLLVAALRRTDDLRLVVLGDGPSRHDVERAVSGAGLEERVTLVGSVARMDVLQWLRAADVAVLSSAWENHPHAVVEALSVGTPAVATRVGGVDEIVEHLRTGLLVEHGDVEGLAAAMREAVRPATAAALRRHLADGAGRIAPETSYGRIAEILDEAARRG